MAGSRLGPPRLHALLGIAAALATVWGPKSGAAQIQFAEVQCSVTGLVFASPPTKCRQIVSQLLTDQARIAFGQRFAAYGATFSIVFEKPDNGYFSRGRRAEEFRQQMVQFNELTKRATDWGQVKQVDSAWVVNFKIQGRDCIAFDNYGPARFDGYAWLIIGYSCPHGLSAPFADSAARAAIATALPLAP